MRERILKDERGRHRQARVDQASDGVANDQTRPGVENDGDVDEASRQGDMGDVADPEGPVVARY
jgi:hypothetical protein